MARELDHFEIRARGVLEQQNPELLSKLFALRTEAKQLSDSQWSKSRKPSADELNASNQKMFDRAAKLLGTEYFERIFGIQPYEKVDLVNPRFLRRPASDMVPAAKPFVRVGGRVRTTSTTVTLRHLAASLAEDNELSKRQAEAILGGLVGNIVKHLKKGQRIRIGGLGILQVRKRAARAGRNPATGEPIQIKASKKVAFRAAKDLKEAI
jgi:DNA-binding protein HU-beta